VQLILPNCEACAVDAAALCFETMSQAIWTNRVPLAEFARQQHRTEDAAWGKAVLDALANLSADPEAVAATIKAVSDGFEWIWLSIKDCLPRKGPVGKALKVLLRNGLLFQRMLVSSCKLGCQVAKHTTVHSSVCLMLQLRARMLHTHLMLLAGPSPKNAGGYAAARAGKQSYAQKLWPKVRPLPTSDKPSMLLMMYNV
jgi:hypothetical protein